MVDDLTQPPDELVQPPGEQELVGAPPVEDPEKEANDAKSMQGRLIKEQERNRKIADYTRQYGVDFDDDGDLDLYVHNFQSPDYFYENPLIYGDNHNFVKVKFAPKGGLGDRYSESPWKDLPGPPIGTLGT